MKKVVFTGGGSAGHVTPNLALISRLRELGWQVDYIGSRTGIENDIIGSAGIPFHPISSGKLRRYMDLKNLKDPFKVVKGVWDSYRVIRKLKPRLVFSKGGFVSVPVVVGAWLNRVPVIIHESDLTPGLANKLSLPFATKVCVTFPETVKHVPAGKAVRTGIPIRSQLKEGSADKGRRLCGFIKQKPVLLVMGGSLGAKAINAAVRDSLPKLLNRFQIVHLCGKGHLHQDLEAAEGYKQFEYVGGELPDLLAMADLVVTRGGATSLYEFLSLSIPMVIIPLTRQASRGDQILNAQSFEGMGYGKTLYEEDLSGDALFDCVQGVYDKREQYITNMRDGADADSVGTIVGLIEAAARR